eukprot:556242_1
MSWLFCFISIVSAVTIIYDDMSTLNDWPSYRYAVVGSWGNNKCTSGGLCIRMGNMGPCNSCGTADGFIQRTIIGIDQYINSFTLQYYWSTVDYNTDADHCQAFYHFDSENDTEIARVSGSKNLAQVNLNIVNPGGKTNLTIKFTTFQTEGKEPCYLDEFYLFGDTSSPTNEPTMVPTFQPTFQPTFVPTFLPTFLPTFVPTFHPTFMPSYTPTEIGGHEVVETTSIMNSESDKEIENDSPLSWLTGYMLWIIVFACLLCCCIIIVVLCIKKREKKKIVTMEKVERELTRIDSASGENITNTMNTTNIVIDEGEQNLNVDYEMNDNNNNNDIYGNDFALKTWLNNINLGIYFD